jgi:hypothetical protein
VGEITTSGKSSAGVAKPKHFPALSAPSENRGTKQGESWW